MKKLIIMSMMILGIAVIAGVAKADVIFAPEWTEFCPPRYCDSNENVFSKDATYWYKRRMQFENALNKCSAYRGQDLERCYLEIRAAESRKNQVWDVRQYEKFRDAEYNREYNMERMHYDEINRMIENLKK